MIISRNFKSLYRKFIPLLADLSDRLLKKDIPWKCSEECQQSFIKLKEALKSTTVLTHYDPKVKIVLACDASSTGIGAVIYHVLSCLPRQDRKANSICIKITVKCRAKLLTD